MAIQARVYRDNLGFGLVCDNGNGGFDDLFFNQKQQQQRDLQFQMFQIQSQNQNRQRLFDQSDFLGSGLTMNTSPNFNNTNELFLEMTQRREIDDYIRLQNERLRSELEEQRKQQLSEIELRARALLERKDHALAASAKRASELESLVLALEAERQKLQKMARDQNAAVLSLNGTLERLLDGGCHVTDAEDSGSCCGGDAPPPENRVFCRRCGGERACMVFLPCRHMCTCRACEPLIGSCPVCESEKKASIEALIF